MKYLMLIYGNQEKWASISAEEIAKQDAFNRKYQATGELIGAYGLADEVQAKLVRRENGQPAVTDGPYLETKEYIASSAGLTITRSTDGPLRAWLRRYETTIRHIRFD